MGEKSQISQQPVCLSTKSLMLNLGTFAIIAFNHAVGGVALYVVYESVVITILS